MFPRAHLRSVPDENKVNRTGARATDYGPCV